MRADREAIALLDRLGLDQPPIPVEDIAAKLGAILMRDDFSDDDVSGLLIREGDEQVIGVNKRHSRARQRFTIAHEIGHLLLHAGKPVILDRARVNFRDAVSSMATDYDEIQANAFAAELLMPRDMVMAESRRLASEHAAEDEDALLQILADRFEVSAEAMNFRLINLGIIWR